MKDDYKNAYTEVLEIIKYFPKEQYEKIPKDKIEFYKRNSNGEYRFYINPNIELGKQNISKEANAILIKLYKDYFATDNQKKAINTLLKINQQKLEQEKTKKYNPNEFFKKYENLNKNTYELKNDNIQENPNETRMIEIKNNFFTKFINFIKNIFS